MGLFGKNKKREDIINVVLKSERIKEYIKSFSIVRKSSENDNSYSVAMFEDTLKQLERRIGQLQEEVNILKKTETSVTITQQQTDQPTTQYLKQRDGNIFCQVSSNPDNSYFQLLNIKGDKGEFRFAGNENYAINNKNEVFDDVADVTASGDSKRIKTIEKGTVVLKDGKWEVIKKAIIKFE